jgi:hypothetical protein
MVVEKRSFFEWLVHRKLWFGKHWTLTGLITTQRRDTKSIKNKYVHRYRYRLKEITKSIYVLGILLSFLIIGIFYELSNNDSDNPLIDNKAKNSIKLLTKGGYEVLTFYKSSSGGVDGQATIKMRSLGKRSEQVIMGLDELSIVYPNVLDYTVRLLDTDEECYYFFESEEIVDNSYRSYSEEEMLSRGFC